METISAKITAAKKRPLSFNITGKKAKLVNAGEKNSINKGNSLVIKFISEQNHGNLSHYLSPIFIINYQDCKSLVVQALFFVTRCF